MIPPHLTSGLIISVSVVGEVEKSKISYRSGAEVNDLVVCTGDLGAAYLGLQILTREKQIFLDRSYYSARFARDMSYLLCKDQLKAEA